MAKREIEERGDDLTEKMVTASHVVKAVKGGHIIAFSALTVVDDGDSHIGIGKNKSKEVSAITQKVMDRTRCSMIKVPLKNGTIHHEVIDRHGTTKVFMQFAKEGSDVEADGPIRLALDAMGIHSISAKVRGFTNPYNIVHTTLDGLSRLYTPANIAAKCDLTVKDILGASHD